jgi:Helicase associated domain
VPTNYRIKVTTKEKKLFVKDDDEDKNLGRWVNRQRSLFQAGKLRKDRQLALEKVGLKWSMLATTTWDEMFETLEEYVKEKTRNGAKWDGNVPANYRTNHDPPRALGRWINRQRSTYGKKKLKDEYTQKLNAIGLRWSVHDRRPGYQYPSTTTTPEGVGSSSAADTANDESDGKDASGTSNGDKEQSGPSQDIAVPDSALSGNVAAATGEMSVTADSIADFSAELELHDFDEKKDSAEV